MKDRLLTFALALAAFAVFYALLAPKPPPPQQVVTRPVTTEKGPNGYYAIHEWLRTSGVQVESLRDRFNRVDVFAPARRDPESLLITTTPHLYPLRRSELQPLRAWIARGNTLLVLAGLSDTPEWSMGEGADPAFMDNMQQLTGLTFSQQSSVAAPIPGGEPVERETEAPAPPASDAETPSEEQSTQAAVDSMQKYAEPQRLELKPNGAHPLLAGVNTVAALSEYPSAKWFAVVNPERGLLELAQDPASGVPVLWLLRYGEGQVLVSAYGSVFANKMLAEADNARLLANIVAASVAQGGRVLIDDAHQGLVAFYDPDAFFGDARLHATLWWLIGLWLVFVLGPRPLHAGRERWAPLDVRSFVRATGGFLARVLKPAQAAQRLFENFFNDLRRRSGLPANGAPVWEAIEAQSSAPAADVARLRELHARALRGGRVDLQQLQTLLARTRSNLR
jgi:hypothetical protein